MSQTITSTNVVVYGIIDKSQVPSSTYIFFADVLNQTISLFILVFQKQAKCCQSLELNFKCRFSYLSLLHEFVCSLSPLIYHSFYFFSLSPGQRAYLSALKLCYLYSAVELFAQWVTDGVYDFSSLPVALKAHLSQEDTVALEKIPTRFKGTAYRPCIDTVMVKIFVPLAV